MESLKKRIKELKNRLLPPPVIHVIVIQSGKGETEKEAIEKYAKAKGIKVSDIINQPNRPVLIDVPSDEQIRARARKGEYN